MHYCIISHSIPICTGMITCKPFVSKHNTNFTAIKNVLVKIGIKLKNRIIEHCMSYVIYVGVEKRNSLMILGYVERDGIVFCWAESARLNVPG